MSFGKCTGLRGWIRKSSESKGSSGVEKMEGNGEFDNKQNYSIKVFMRVVYKVSYVVWC